MKLRVIGLNILGLILSVQTTSAIRLSTARGISSGVGLGTAALAYYILGKEIFANVCINGSTGQITHSTDQVYRSVMSGAVGLITGGLSYLVLSRITPEGRFDRAQNYVQRAMQNRMALESFESNQDFFDALQEVYVTDDLWLVGAYNNLAGLLVSVRRALELCEMVRIEAYDDTVLVQKSNVLVGQARKALKNLTAAVKRIRNDKEYVAQLKLYKQLIMEEKKLQVQKEIAQAEREKAKAQTSIAQSQKERTDIEGINAAVNIQKIYGR